VHVAPASDVRVATPDVRAAVSEAPAVATAARLIQKAGSGKLLSFVGAKGGAGTTCLASNFAVSLAEESGKRTILIDLNLPLGNVALELGVNAQYSTVDALKNSTRLDATFLSKLLVKHRSGLHVLAAPDNFAQPVQVTPEAIENLLNVARQEFEYVVVDAGVRHELKDSAFLEESAHLYLVTQDGLPELRNSNRLIAEYFASGGPKLDIVLNRYMGRTESNGMYSSHLVDDKHITKALTREVSWKIPSDPSEAVLVAVDSAVSRAIRAMARSVCGLPAIQEPKKKFSLFPQKKKPFKFLD
jgi:pilus assembly protein CpaE